MIKIFLARLEPLSIKQPIFYRCGDRIMQKTGKIFQIGIISEKLDHYIIFEYV